VGLSSFTFYDDNDDDNDNDDDDDDFSGQNLRKYNTYHPKVDYNERKSCVSHYFNRCIRKEKCLRLSETCKVSTHKKCHSVKALMLDCYIRQRSHNERPGLKTFCCSKC